MKKLTILFVCAFAFGLHAQDFDKNMASARSSYSAGDLENARFATEQLLRDLDIAIGKEILKMLPTEVATLKADTKNDNLTGGAGYAGGLFVQRSYGDANRSANIDIINNSPLMNSIQAILSMPLLGGMVRDENQKQIKVQGYKALLNRTIDSETSKTNYELQVPMNNTLLTLKIENTTEAEITQVANAIPLAKIAQIAQ
jgi:hypothetical protein